MKTRAECYCRSHSAADLNVLSPPEDSLRPKQDQPNQAGDTLRIAITQISLNTLYAFLKLKPFVGMNEIEELEQWFKDRMLGAADDLS